MKLLGGLLRSQFTHLIWFVFSANALPVVWTQRFPFDLWHPTVARSVMSTIICSRSICQGNAAGEPLQLDGSCLRSINQSARSKLWREANSTFSFHLCYLSQAHGGNLHINEIVTGVHQTATSEGWLGSAVVNLGFGPPGPQGEASPHKNPKLYSTKQSLWNEHSCHKI